MTIKITPQELEESAKIGAEIRHEIHRHPEVGLNLPHTKQVIIDSLKKMGVTDIHEVGGEGVSGVVAVIKGDKPGRVIGLRADSDALPLMEKTGAPWSSQEDHKMHACGHDGHVATLLAAVDYLVKHKDFAGTVVAIFQPGEEGFAGARYMIEDGLVDRFGIDEFYALHAEPTVKVGNVAFVEGFATANADIFKIVFKGKGGHGSRPHLANDPLVTACECVVALQSIVSRSVDPNKTAVVSVGCVSSGKEDGSSVIPQEATLVGTCRSFEKEVQDTIVKRLTAIAKGVALANDMEAEVTYTKLYPAMYNTPEMVQKAREYLTESLGADKIDQFMRTAGGEDFSFMLAARPGCLFRLGMKDDTHNCSVHQPGFDYNDKAIATGASSLLTIALNRAAAQ